MVVVAVAGGTGGVGRTIVETLRQNPRYKTIVLARKVRYPVHQHLERESHLISI